MTEPQEPRSAAPQHPAPEELSVYVFSPQEAAAGVREHTEGCAVCAAEVEDLRLVLSGLAQLPEPELPVEVGIRLDAAIARAWQEADADQAAEAAAPPASPRRRRSWRRFAAPVGALGLLVVAGVGVGLALSHGQSSSATASGSAAQAPVDAKLNQWVHSVLPDDTPGAGPAQTSSGMNPQVQNGSIGTMATTAKGAHSADSCASYPQRTGYQVLTTSQREFDGKQATLVVYQNAAGPASPTVYAVVYAGPCPSSSSQVLDQGFVSR